VILPPREQIGFSSLLAAPTIGRISKEMRTPGAADAPNLPPALAARFTAAREKLGQPAARYSGQPGVVAAMMLNGDAFRSQAPWISDEGKTNAAGDMVYGPRVWQTVEALAKARKAPVEPGYTYGFERMAAFLEDTRRPGEACIAALIDDIETRKDWTPAPGEMEAALAWADGDVRPTLERGRGRTPQTWLWLSSNSDAALNIRAVSPACLTAMTGLRDHNERMRAEVVRAMRAALVKPGHSVAVVQVGELLRADGILDRLRRSGYEITLPDKS
jgi:hypothetical protein